MVASRFVWHDLMSTDVTRSKAFYSALFGWTTSTFEMGAYGTYTMIKSGPMDIGGIMPLDARLGARTIWLSYVNVPSVENTSARAVSMGGKLLVPSAEIPNVGRYAVIADQQGAIISPFTRLGGDNPEPDHVPPPGAFAWDELLTDDTRSAATFYASLFRWRPHVRDGRTVLRRGDKETAEVTAAPGGAGSAMGKSPIWVPHVSVERVADAVDLVVRLKGAVLASRAGFALVADTLGGVVAVVGA